VLLDCGPESGTVVGPRWPEMVLWRISRSLNDVVHLETRTADAYSGNSQASSSRCLRSSIGHQRLPRMPSTGSVSFVPAGMNVDITGLENGVRPMRRIAIEAGKIPTPPPVRRTVLVWIWPSPTLA